VSRLLSERSASITWHRALLLDAASVNGRLLDRVSTFGGAPREGYKPLSTLIDNRLIAQADWRRIAPCGTKKLVERLLLNGDVIRV